MERPGVEISGSKLGDPERMCFPPRSKSASDWVARDLRRERMDCDSEEQPFLSEVVDGNETEPPRKTTTRWACGWGPSLGMLLLGFILAMVFALTALSFGLANTAPIEQNDQDGEIAADYDSSADGQTTQTDHILYKENIPITPALRSASEYILSPTWDYQSPPTVREYNWVITNAVLNPDGVFRPMVLINNQFPGPLVEINEGDTLIFHISNQGVNATSMHFHGMFQNGTNAMDGTVGVTQCPIAPGSNYTYKFEVKGQSGTYWYHAHHSAQASDGLLGPMVVHARNEKTVLQRLSYATDRVVMVQDHYHNTTAELLMDYLQPGRENDEPVPDSALINGQGTRDCKDFPGRSCNSTLLGTQSFAILRGSRHRLRFINVGAFAEFQIEVDEHPFYVTEVDGTDVSPEPFHRLNILPAQRYSIVLEANSTSNDAFWLRARMVTHCFRRENSHMKEDIRAIVRYTDHGDQTTNSLSPEPTSSSWDETIEVICRDLNTSTLHPVVKQDAVPSDGFVPLRANFMTGAWRLTRGFFNGSNWHMNVTSPTLHRFLDARSKLTSLDNADSSFGINTQLFDPTQDFVLQTRGIRTLDLAINNFDDGAHPFHLHGHKFFVLTPSLKGYPPKPEDLPQYLDETGALENPLRRDTVTVGGYQWVIIRVVLDNPGMWAFHCHNSWHAEAGMVMQMLVRGEDVGRSQVGQVERELCTREHVTRGGKPDDSIWFGQFGRPRE